MRSRMPVVGHDKQESIIWNELALLYGLTIMYSAGVSLQSLWWAQHGGDKRTNWL